ncbi:39S ribosomal protein L52, mitochondrial-like isoform X2 [Xyrauchen texanus]|uniref:39S ribosomal protein L52, mitochondrial-like isoform X2 n=1 Tax=Xyrauchen texanus TaxID=154827 RepID=UPI0022418F90|nr:39S ribosomal protein L52, mitochondrial-like isoform X2 [Xyrauchen texanus]
MAAPLRTFCSAVLTQSIRPFSSTCVTHAGEKWRLENGLARSGSEYGPLTDLPDWSYADGRHAPLLKGQIRRQKQREEFASRAVYLNAEVDKGMERWQEKKEEERLKVEQLKSLMLKPKGNLLLKNK